MRAFLTLLALAAAPAVALAQDTTATFVDADGAETGTAAISAVPDGVLFELDLSGMPASSWVAFHVHETGSCDPATHHESAGGHFNPDGAEHGYLVDAGPHAGDMPNVWADADGNVHAQVFNPMVTYPDGPSGIRGRALMIHAGPDDYQTQPSGGAGDRIACAVIE